MMDNSLKIKMFAVTLDCNDSHKLADFYAALLNWEKGHNDEGWAWVTPPEKYPFILFQQIDNYVPPVWPNEPEMQSQMAHIDFAVNDIEKATKHAINCGAKMATEQFSSTWTVMLDPVGHPFCLCPKRTIFTIGE